MASEAVTAATGSYVLESDSTAREFTIAPPDSNAGYWSMTVQNVGANPAEIKLTDADPDGDPDSPTQQADEGLIQPNGSYAIPLGTLTFHHVSTTGTILNVILDKRGG